MKPTSCRKAFLFGTSLTTAATVAMLSAQALAGSIVADGKLDASYQLGFSIGFLDDKGNSIGDGRLFFGVNDSDKTQFLYFQLPVNYVDNTYGTNAAVDWNKGHTFDNLYGSDRWGATQGFQWNKNSVTFDYIAGVCSSSSGDKCDKGAAITDYRSGGMKTVLNDGALAKNDGAVNTNAGGIGDILEVATSLEYNFDQYGMTYLTDSPVLDSNTAGNIVYHSAAAPDWIYEVGYEIQFAAGTFNDALWLNPGAAPDLITLGDVHASPSKTGYSSYGEPVCIQGCSQQDIPEPGGTLLFGTGLGLLGWLGRRRRRRDNAV